MTPTPPPAPRPPATVSLSSLARAVRRYSLVFALFVLVAAAAGAGVWFFLPLPAWTGSVTFRVAATPPGVVNSFAAPQLDFVSYKQQQQAILKSKVLMSAALADPAVSGLPMLDPNKIVDPVAWLINNLKIDYPLGPEYMRLSYEGDEPVQITAVLKAVEKAYRKETEGRDKNDKRNRLQQLLKTREQYTTKLDENRKQILETMRRLSVASPVSLMYRERAIETRISSTLTQLDRVATGLRENESQALTEGFGQGTVPAPIDVADAVVDEVVLNSLEMRKLHDAIAQLDTEIEGESKPLLPGVTNPRVIALRAEKARQDEELKKLPARLRPKVAAELKAGLVAEGRRKALTYNQKTALMKTWQQALTEDWKRLITERTDLTTTSIEVSALQQKVASVEAMDARLEDQIEALKPELDAPARVTIWEEPSIAPGIEGNRRAKYTGMAAGAFLLLGLVLVQWLEYSGRRVQTAEEVSHGTGLAVISSVPFIPKSGRPADQGVWTHLLTEAVNTTRTMILNPRVTPDLPPPRTILVTSAASGEGKTSIVTHLAVSLAGAGRRVLLIDADMRRPTAHIVLGVPEGPGLSEYLTGAVEANAVIGDCRVDGLHIVAAGRWQAAAAAALTTDRWNHLLRDMASRYDFVLIDSPPVLPVADSLSIARTVDAVLFAVMCDRSRFVAVQAACGRLQMVGARMLGVVLSGTTAASRHYYDRHYYRATVEAQEVVALAAAK